MTITKTISTHAGIHLASMLALGMGDTPPKPKPFEAPKLTNVVTKVKVEKRHNPRAGKRGKKK